MIFRPGIDLLAVSQKLLVYYIFGVLYYIVLYYMTFIVKIIIFLIICIYIILKLNLLLVGLNLLTDYHDLDRVRLSAE